MGILFLLVVMLLPFALSGCTQQKSPCAGLVYKDYGLSGTEYGACAKAQVVQLDAMHAALVTLSNASQPKTARVSAKSDCLRAGAQLGRLIREAGGPEKLIYIPWADPSLNRFNLDVATARETYAMYCYYGLPGMGGQIDPGHAEAQAYAAALP